MHYWRLNPGRWPEVLDRVREIGLKVVATYVPWQYHELAPGQFDFTGQTEPPRNLVGFLRLAQEKGFRVFIRLRQVYFLRAGPRIVRSAKDTC